MSDYDEGNECPECGCTMMNGTDWCPVCGYGMDACEGGDDEE